MTGRILPGTHPMFQWSRITFFALRIMEIPLLQVARVLQRRFGQDLWRWSTSRKNHPLVLLIPRFTTLRLDPIMGPILMILTTIATTAPPRHVRLARDMILAPAGGVPSATSSRI